MIVVVVIISIKIFSSEDTRICQHGQWIMHGKPSFSKPLTWCIAESSWTIQPSVLFSLSSVFTDGANISADYTCQGKDIQPPFMLAGIPSQTQSLALLVTDPDASNWTWFHGVFWNIPLEENFAQGDFPKWTFQGKNSWWTVWYRWPCPPTGTHRYIFTMYALDTLLNIPKGSSHKILENAMKNHILGTAVLMGFYKKN